MPSHFTNPLKRSRRLNQQGFTLMELLVVTAVIMVLAAIALPVYSTLRQRVNKTKALSRMNQLGTAFAAYTAENNGKMPVEDAAGTDTWANAALPEHENVWYNALPPLAGQNPVGFYAANPQSFYNKGNMLYLPGAAYPEPEKTLSKPYFAMAMNSKLQRKNEEGVKEDVLISKVTYPSRTVVFLERGMSGEPKNIPAQGGYSGKPKASGRSFIGRYQGQGVLTFLDGHAESVDATEILDPAGQIRLPQTDYIWTLKPEDDPN